MTPAPSTRISWLAIWNMSFGFLGIQFGWGLQMANMSAIYQYLGAGEEDIALLWLAAPVTGLLVQPVVGYYSDRTWNRLGRRRPYFLVGAILASLALIAMPNSSTLWMAAGLLWVLDASVNISMEPFRAFVADLLPPQQRKTGFAMQSLLIGLGAVLASTMPWLLTHVFRLASGSPDVVLVAADGERAIDLDTAIPASVHLSFYIGSALFLATVLYTIITTKENPPADLAGFRRMQAESGGVTGVFREIIHGIGQMPATMRRLAVVQFFTWFGLFCLWIYFIPGVGTRVYDGRPLGDDLTAAMERDPVRTTAHLAAAKSVLVVARAESGAQADRAVQMTTADFMARVQARATTDISAVPLTPIERRNPLYTTAAGLLLEPTPAASITSGAALAVRLAQAARYEAGVAQGGNFFGAYNAIAFAFAFVLLALVRKTSARNIHATCLVLGAIGLASAGLIRTPALLWGSMTLIGIAWASILSMPYAMLSNVLPAEKMGFYMGVFNFFIVLPQIVASALLGRVVAHLLGGNGMLAVVLGGVSMFIAALALIFVREEAKVPSTSAAEAPAAS